MRPVTRPGPGSRVTVVGLGRSGLAAAQWLRRMKCFVRATEQAKTAAHQAAARQLRAIGVGVELGRHTRHFLQGAELVVVSPGVALSADPVRWARAQGTPVVSELECASWYCPSRLVAVTGSNGKSTVVTWLGQLLRQVGQEAVVCGNLGEPLSGFLGKIRPSTVVVVEVSSFQLEACLSFNPEVACVTNLTENHLDRHGSMARYRGLKGRLLAHQSRHSWALLNADDPGSTPLFSQVRGQCLAFSRKRQGGLGAFVRDGQLWMNLPWASGPVCRVGALAVAGLHNQENALAVIGLAGLLGVEPSQMGGGLCSFQGLPHRQQRVATLEGVTFINDSKSTTVEAGLRAIESAPGPVVLIAGGRDKGGDFRRLKAQARKLKAVVLIGEDGPKIGAAIRGAVALCRSRDLEAAVRKAYALAGAGECVLLSPMCTSFDMFRDFEERGRRFTEAVRALQGNDSRGAESG